MLSPWEPFGKALLSYWNDDREACIGIKINEEAPDQMPVSIYFRTLDEMPELEAYALNLCKGKILDIGAGVGAHSLILQEEGKEVIGLDISPEAVEIMKARGIRQSQCGSFLDFHPEHKFDTLLFLMNGIGIAGDIDGLKKYLIHAKNLCESDGQIILDSSDLRLTNNLLQQKDHYFGIVDYQLSFERQIGKPYQWLYIDPDFLIEIAKSTGWLCQIVYENEDGSYLARLIKE